MKIQALSDGFRILLLSCCFYFSAVVCGLGQWSWELSRTEGPENIRIKIFGETGDVRMEFTARQLLLEDGKIGFMRSALLRKPVLIDVQLMLQEASDLEQVPYIFETLNLTGPLFCRDFVVTISNIRLSAPTAQLQPDSITLFTTIEAPPIDKDDSLLLFASFENRTNPESLTIQIKTKQP